MAGSGRGRRRMLRRPTGRRGRLVMIGAVVASFLATATVVTASVAGEQVDGFTLFAETDVSRVPVDPDTRPVELGVRFTADRDGVVTAVRFLKAKGDRGRHRVNLWTADGERLATAVPKRESRSGWQHVALPEPVEVEAGEVYVASYHTSRYRATQRYFERPVSAGPLRADGTAGVYAYGSGGFPRQTWKASNYWVDLAFEPTGSQQPEPTPSPTASAEPSPTPSPSASPTATPSASPSASPTSGTPAVLDLPRVPWEGGPAFYANFPQARASGWTDPSFFPIGVWYEGVYTQQDIDRDKAAGLNTYVMLTDQSDVSLIRRNDMYAFIPQPFSDRGNESVGWVIGDEADMWGGPGNGTWTGNYPGQGPICTSSRDGCGLDVMKKESATVPSGDRGLRYANYGKGVMFWQSDSDASKFVNGFSSVVSNDIYWYTDPHVCTAPAEGPTYGVNKDNCRRAANYGLTMQRMRELDAMDGKRQPVWAFVEVGHPFTEDWAPTITGEQVTGAVMNSVINEARGIQYFNHNFGGPCLSQHVLRERCGDAVRPAVAEVNKRITSLAPVLNTQSYEWEFNNGLDTMLKAHDGSFYVFAMVGKDTPTGDHSLALPPGVTGDTAEVLFENRSLPISGGAIRDTFAAEHTYHIYKITP
ncbi:MULTISPECIES: DUF4082 domain-containing protein [unclassified Solwaraspora]|uniref:DUF4082 domain-containing protein n=1 Tax=unclassified Solwaraspora TaxID=2627926 RepID=UPI00248B2889|nr:MULTISPECIES: DUF4082 domain-containing protein [unclassified Solwaraspora]WBB95761.1 DUF4082 domain-containing protein [Solwaraspora sp. WMMA2059]WBC20335.1 DUF4082 domain-containing protein [Solwaraspora sp. WMMA2080]WJK37514.1 DUF4082 domain-containing protein [Solwaraspora sp. WMMA2065]